VLYESSIGWSIMCQNTESPPCDIGNTHHDWTREAVIEMWNRRHPNSMFGPKSPAERAAPRDSVISWANYEPVGGYCQHVYFGQNAQQMEPLGWVAGWWSSPRRCALAR
jgi:hypothetical protein